MNANRKARPLIVISTGDPAGVGPEVSLKALRYFSPHYRTVAVGPRKILEDAASLVSLPWPLESMDGHGDFSGSTAVHCIDVDERAVVKGAESEEAGMTAMDILRKAVSFCTGRPDCVLVTAPINKKSMAMARWSGGGHTEFLRDITGVKRTETIFCLEDLKVFFLTRHLSLRKALDAITKEAVTEAVMRVDRYMKELGKEQPRIGLPGLNPHCSDGGLFGDEEQEILVPAIEEVQARGISAEGPVGADSIYSLGLKGRYDAILSLYHDQGHIALKTRDFDGTVTMTLGLPFLRTSVDHGTALDIAWKGSASETSMIKAIDLAIKTYATMSSACP